MIYKKGHIQDSLYVYTPLKLFCKNFPGGFGSVHCKKMYAVHTVVNQIAYLIAGVLDARLAHVLVVIAVFVHHYYQFCGNGCTTKICNAFNLVGFKSNGTRDTY